MKTMSARCKPKMKEGCGAGGEVLGLLQTEHSGIGFNPFVNASHTDAERHYFGKDHLGSIRAVTNQWGSPLYTFDYDVFGQPLQDRPERFRPGFTGKEYDSWTGLYNYGFRDYAPVLGRFTTVDPVQDGHNWYAYVNSDPVSWLDPWGLEGKPSGEDSARNSVTERRNEEKTVRQWLYSAVKFISDNAETEYEHLLADKLTDMMNNGKIQLDNLQNRYCRADDPKNGPTKRAIFDFYLNTETKQPRNIIVMDTHNMYTGGYEAFLSTVAHEGWHAVQYDNGLFAVDEDNNSTIKTYGQQTNIELGAYNMGVMMYNKYAEKNNLELQELYSWKDINALLHRTNK